MLKIGIFDPYIKTLGGGERYFLTIAEHFKKENDVFIFWDDEKIISSVLERHNIDLSGVKFLPNVFKKGTTLDRLKSLMGFDLLFFLSDGSLPFSSSKRTIVHFQVPFLNVPNGIVSKIKLARIEKIICNSFFTKKTIDETFKVDSSVIYPPVDTNIFVPANKENIILTVGRFSGGLHPKKHEFMVSVFKELFDKGLADWKFYLLGGVAPEDKEYISFLRKEAESYPIYIEEDATFEKLKDLYGRAKLYWHATGFLESVSGHPERFEHFGITTVEAMSAGCVPVVIKAGGQPEIVDDGKNGFLWENRAEFIEKTLSIISDKETWGKFSKAAQEKSKNFDKKIFCENIDRLVFGKQR